MNLSQADVPTRFQLACDQSVLRVHRFVTARRQTRLVVCLFQFQFQRFPLLLLLFTNLFSRFQRCLHRIAADCLKHFFRNSFIRF